MPAPLELRKVVRVPAIIVWADLGRALNDKGECVQEREEHCGNVGVVKDLFLVPVPIRGRTLTEEPRQPLMEDLQLFVRGSDDEADEVDLGAEGEDEGEAAECEHAGTDRERGTPDVPARAVLYRRGDKPRVSFDISAGRRIGTGQGSRRVFAQRSRLWVKRLSAGLA